MKNALNVSLIAAFCESGTDSRELICSRKDVLTFSECWSFASTEFVAPTNIPPIANRPSAVWNNRPILISITLRISQALIRNLKHLLSHIIQQKATETITLNSKKPDSATKISFCSNLKRFFRPNHRTPETTVRSLFP